MPVRPDNVAQFIFADRTDESVALRQSVLAIAGRLREQREIDTAGLRNVLVYFGVGGIGKSKLSERLEAWCRHDLPETEDWGCPPLPEATQTARWNFNGFQGQIDVPSLMITLRAAVSSKKQRWPAFDLALAAYLAATRPGQSVATTTAADQTGDLLSVLGGIAGDLGAPGLITEFSVAAVGKLVSLAMMKLNKSRQLKRFDSLRGVLDACARIPVGDNAPDAAAEILWLLAEEVEAREPAKRPVVVVFVDHFEKLQASIKAEQVINRLMGYLPWVLFVVTGRNRLDWHTERDELKISGPRRWPLLAPGVAEEPHQHLLGHLSPEDARGLLVRRRELGGWSLSEDLLDKIVEKSGGWPLHIEAVCQVATNRTISGDDDLTEDELLRDLPGLVRHLFEDLTSEEAHVFNAACLLPYFDIPLAAAVADTSGGAVERCIERTIVDDNPDSLYPHRVHEEIRHLVRQAGSSVKGGWSSYDWKKAAARALAEAKCRHDAAKAAADAAEQAGKPRNDGAVTEAIVLGLTVALREDVYGDWLGLAIRWAPTILGLASFLPTPDDDQVATEAGALIQHVFALALPSREGIPLLEALWSGTAKVKRSAGLWLAYRLRSEGCYPEAVAQLKRLVETCASDPEDLDLFHGQVAVTLRMERLFGQALDYFESTLGATAIGYESFRAVCWQNNGIYGQPRRLFEERISRQKSARFRLDLRTSYLRRKVLEGDDCRLEARALLDKSVEMAMPADQMNCLWALGTFQLAQSSALEETIRRMRQLVPQYHEGSLLGELLALRAFLSKDDHDIEAAVRAVPHRAIRSSTFLLTEILLDDLGSPLPPTGQPEEWLIPYDEVRQNWLELATGVLDRARTIGQIEA